MDEGGGRGTGAVASLGAVGARVGSAGSTNHGAVEYRSAGGPRRECSRAVLTRRRSDMGEVNLLAAK